jgi:hypothetical protein
MNEKYLQDLYALIKGKDSSYEGRYSYDQFKTKIQDDAYAEQMHSWLSKRDESFKQKPLETFIGEVKGGPASRKPVTAQKKKFSLDSEVPQQEEAASTGLSLGGGSSATQPTNKKLPKFKILTKEDFSRIDLSPKTDQQRFFEERQAEFKKSIAVIRETEKRQKLEAVEEAEKAKGTKALNKNIKSAPDFVKSIDAISANLTSKTEEEAITELRSKFSKFGINFEETGFGTDKIIAKSLDGKKSITVDLDNWTTGGDIEAAKRLKAFISENAIPVETPITGDLLTKSIQAQNLRKTGRLNPDGTLSTVKFTSFEEDGKFKVVPTLFPKDPNNYSSDPKTWEELPFKEAVKRARERGEVFDFKTDKEAKDFAKGSWKDVNKIDNEGEKFYKQRGLDYMSNKKTYDEYVKVRDMVDFIEENVGAKNITARDGASKYPNLVINGRLRSDAEKLLQKYKSQEEALRGQVFDSGFFSEGKVEQAREDFDLYLDKKSNEIAQDAAKVNNKAKQEKAVVDEQSMKIFNMPIDKLPSYQPKNDREKFQKSNLIKQYQEVKLTQDFAARKYEDAKTYFDAKANKQIQGEFDDNISGAWNAITDAYDRGQAAQQILAFALGIKDVNSKTDREEASRIIIENLTTDQSGKTSRVMSRWQQATGAAESFDVFLDNPFELALTFAGTSLSQILPYGMKIVPTAIAAGAGTGAAAGLAGGPFAEVTVPGGAIAGAGYGFRTGMAATSLAMEYTNSVLDVMREKGYDINDPNQVAEALSNDEVWSEGGERGLKRGIPIAVVDYLSAGLAGKVFKPTSVLAGTGQRIALQTAERGIVDPLAEATGELAAQISSGQEVDWKEISAEALGGIGNNSSNMAINTYRNIRNNSNIEIANKLTDASFVGTESASDTKISSWANNMQQLGKIDADTNQRIQENVGLRREAREALSVGENKNNIKPSVLARTMELMSAKEELSSSTNRKEIYSEKIKAINNELSIIAETKELAPEESSIDLSTTLGTTKKGVGQYIINGVRYTKEQFLEKTEGMTARRLLRSALGVKNDDETANALKEIISQKTQSELSTDELTNLLNQEEDAIQEQATNESVLRTEQPGLGLQEVGERNIQPEGIAEETVFDAQQEEVEQSELQKELKKMQAPQRLIDAIPTDTTLREGFLSDMKDLGASLFGQAGVFKIAENSVSVGKFFSALSGGRDRILFHEAAHAATVITMNDILKNPNDYTAEQVKANEELWDIARDYRFNRTSNATMFQPYGINNQYEFVAEFISNPKFREFVGKNNPDDKVRLRDLIWTKILQMLGMNKKEISTERIAQIEKAIDTTLGASIERNARNKAKTQTQENGKTTTNEVQSQRTGNGRTTRAAISKTAPLEGAPKVEGATGPNQELVSVAERYAAENGIDLKRQGEYVEVNEERAQRIADAYEAMENNPQNPKVKEAYAELIKQTKAQYQALVDAGYKFWFIDLNNPENIDYISSPYNSMRDLRQNKQMGVFPTEEGFGSNEDVDVSQNPLLEDTGITWAVGGLDGEMKPVTANDLFRAVHDAFGHGLEGAGFRARGEENAWQAHSRLFTGAAIGAMTSETRGQNSWVNYGPEGVNNRTASAEDTVFADQKVGLMPAWTWTEGVAPDMQEEATDYKAISKKVLDKKELNTVRASLRASSPDSFSLEILDAIAKGQSADTGNDALNVQIEESIENGVSIGTIANLILQDESIVESKNIDSRRKAIDYVLNIGAKGTILKAGQQSVSSKTQEKKDFEEGVDQTNENFAELLDLDTKDKTNLEKVSAFLDKADTYLSSELSPNKLNDVTRVMALGTAKVIVKTLKTLVNTGMKLQEAIQRVSEIYNVSTEKIDEALQIVATATQNVSEGISEFEIPGFNRMMVEAEGIVEKSKKRRVSAQKTADNVMSYVMGSKVYEDATDVQRELLVRAVRKRFNLKEKQAPSVGKLFGTIKNVTKITMTEKTALKKQIKDLGRGARDAVKAWRIASQQLSKDIKELKGTGKINAEQAANVIRAFSKVNVFSETSVERFTNYMTKVFNNADYANKLTKAKNTRASIKKMSRDAKRNADLRVLATKFAEIDPSLVKSIEAYNDIADKIEEAIKGSSIRGQRVSFSETVNIENANEYVTEAMKNQVKVLRDERIAEIESLYGVDAKDFSEAEMNALLQEDKPMSDKNNEIVKRTIERAFDIYSAIIKDAINTGVDSITGEDVSYTRREREIISKFMAMNPNNMKPKTALAAVDALANFLENKSIAGMVAVTSTYEGENNTKIVLSKGIQSIALKKYWSKGLGRTFGEQTTNLNILFEKMFKGFNRGGTVQDLMGLTKLINKKAFALTQSNAIINDYVKAFYDKNVTPNGQAFNTTYNNIERGMAAFMLRNVIGTEEQMQAEFNRRKGLIEQSIAALSIGNEQEKKKAEVYQKVYDKVLSEATNIQDIYDNTDIINLEAIDFWQKQWDSKFDALSDVALGVYNKVLDRDLNYTPDRYSRMQSAPKEVDITNSESAFIFNTNGVLYNKKTGVLMDTTGTANLPKNSDNQALSFIDLSFDRNNSNSMYDALVDIETAAPIRQVQAFLNSSNFSKIVPSSEDAALLKNRIDLYVRNVRNKNPYSNDELSAAVRRLNKIATLGVTQSLAGAFQPIKQIMPVAVNTLINSGSMGIGAAFDPAFNAWLNQSGYAIANRGVESQAEIDSINQMIEEAADSKPKKAMKLIEDANKKVLNMLLVRPDVAVARASFAAYYEKYLKDNGLYETTERVQTDYGEVEVTKKGIDYSNHPLNEDAANYAQRMVDRQQNVSDTDLAGSLFSSKETGKQVLVKLLMPFASFRMNQASRIAADLSTLGYWGVSTREDKVIAARSLSGYAAELVTFKAISAGISLAMGYAAAAMMGHSESDDEEEKRQESIIKGQATGLVTDILSPLPFLDKGIQTISANLLDIVNEAADVSEEDRLAIYGTKKEDFLKNMGMYGIAPDRLAQLYDLIVMSVSGKYKDDFGKEQEISDDSKEALAFLIGPAILSNFGLGTAEIASVIRNSVKMAKKKKTSYEERQAKEEKRLKKEEEDANEVRILEEISIDTSDPEKLALIQDQIRRLTNETEAEADERKAKNKEIKQEKAKLLGEYANETEMKRYDRALWEETFGENSEWYNEYREEKLLQKEVEDAIQRIKDEEYNYTPVGKEKYQFGPQTTKSKSKKFGYSFGPQESKSDEKGSSSDYKFGPQK